MNIKKLSRDISRRTDVITKRFAFYMSEQYQLNSPNTLRIQWDRECYTNCEIVLTVI